MHAYQGGPVAVKIVLFILWMLFMLGWAALSVFAVLALWKAARAFESAARSLQQIADRGGPGPTGS